MMLVTLKNFFEVEIMSSNMVIISYKQIARNFRLPYKNQRWKICSLL